jgi:hypothetical protein
MASTGLLGINPYKRGVAIDISSKPTQMLIQLQQKEQAKNEALDKYFMDYDKNITPAGMRNQDIEGLMRRKNEAKQYYFQNKEAIRRPELDNGKAYSQFMGMNTDQLGYVTKSKEQTGKAKALSTAMMDAQKRKEIAEDGVAQGIALNELALDDPKRVDFDIANFRTYSQHDPIKYQQDIYGRLRPDLETEKEVFNKATGKYELIKTKDITKNALNRITTDVYGTYDRDRGLQVAVRDIASDINKVNELASIYKDFTGKDMPRTEKDIAVAYTIAMKPAAEVSTEISDWRDRQNRQDALARSRADLKAQNMPKMKNLFDMTGSGGVPVKLGSTGYEIVAGKVLDKEGKPATINLKDVSGSNFQPEFYSALENYGIDLRSRDKYKLVAKDGIIQSITSPKNKVITRTTIMNAQKKFDTERKGESPLYSYEEEVEDVVTPGGVDLNKFLKKQ